MTEGERADKKETKTFQERIAEHPVLWLLRAVVATAVFVCGAIAGGKELLGVDVVPENQYVLTSELQKDYVKRQELDSNYVARSIVNAEYVHRSNLDREYLSKTEVQASYILRSACESQRAVVPAKIVVPATESPFSCLSAPSRWTGQLNANGGSYAIRLELARQGQRLNARYLSTSSQWRGPYRMSLDSQTGRISFTDEPPNQSTWTLYCNDNGVLSGYLQQGSRQNAEVSFTRSP